MAESTFEIELDKLNACIHCGMCLPTCPTYRVTGSEAESPRGRLYLMKKMLKGELAEPKQLSEHLDQCLGCVACETACPSGVQYGALLIESREALLKNEPSSWRRNLRRWVYQRILPNAALLKAMGFFLWLYQRVGLQALVRGLGVLNFIPPLAYQESLMPAVGSGKPLKAGMAFGDSTHPKAALLTGCVMDVFYRPIHWATVKTLVGNGYYVAIPEQTCCGALAHHAGEGDISKALAKKNIELVLKDNPDFIVVNSGGCGSSLKEYGHLLKDDADYQKRAEIFSSKMRDVMELLAEKPLQMPEYARVEQTITYHASCHLHHAQGVKNQTQQVLSQVPGLNLVPLKEYDMCCGSAGVYNLAQPELATEILAMKTQRLKETYEQTGATCVVTGNPGCLLQIEKGLRDTGVSMAVKHPVEILALAYKDITL